MNRFFWWLRTNSQKYLLEAVQADLAAVLHVAADIVERELDDHRRLAVAVQAHAATVVHPWRGAQPRCMHRPRQCNRRHGCGGVP